MPLATLGIVCIDLEVNGLGLPSRAAEPFADGTVLGKTIERLKRCRTVDDWIISAPEPQIQRIRDLLGSEAPAIESIRSPEPPWREAVRRGRKWSLDGWRGGVARSSLFDEEGNPVEFARLAQAHSAEQILQVRAESPLVDPDLIDGLVLRVAETDPRPPLMYGSIPPGLGGWLFRVEFLQDLVEQGVHPGYFFGYRAWDPTVDLTEQLFAYKPPIEISRLDARLLADNRHSLGLVRRFESVADTVDALTIACEIEAHPEWLTPEAPAEVELEITTRRSIGHRFLPSVDRPDMEPETWSRIVGDYAASSDLALVTLGGHGDPLEHPDVFEMLDDAKRLGAYGLSMITDGLRLTTESIDRLLASDLDVLCVRLDAASAETYRAAHDADRYEEVVGNLRAFLERRRTREQRTPLLVVSITRRKATLGELERFYDEWSTAADAAVIVAHDDFAGQVPADEVLDLEPPDRQPCYRLRRRMMVHGDGVAVTCSEDFAAKQTLGRIDGESLSAIWTGAELAKARRSHAEHRWDDAPLCPRCRQWRQP